MALSEAQKRRAEKNRRYWAEREAEQLKHNITEEAEYDKEIRRIHTDMLDGIQKEIDSFYAKYAKAEGITLAEAKKRVSKLDIAAYERKAARYVRTKDFSKKANEEMRLYNATMKINRLEMLKANIGLELIAGHDELEKFMGGILQGRTEDELARQAGILGKTVKRNAQLAHAIVNGSFHSGTFSDRIWQYQDLMRQDLGKLLQQGLIQGKGARAITADLRKYLIGDKQGKGATYNVERLMRTELARVQTEAQKQSFARNGFDFYEFICNFHDSKSGTCEVCKALNGKHFKVENMMPGENAPPMHPHCRCSTAAWEDSDEYEAWLDFLEAGGTTEEWKEANGRFRAEQAEKAEPKAKAPARMGETKTFDALEEYLQREYNVSVDSSVKKLDFGSVRDALSGLESVVDRYPGLKKYIRKLTTSKSGMMSCSGEEVTFNPYYFESAERVADTCDKSTATGWWVKNASSASIGAHETAHALEWLLIQSNGNYEYDWQRIDAWNKCTEAKRIVSQACKNVKKTEYGKGKKNAELISAISRYAQSTASETMAEAFADIYANGENASPLSLEIERLTRETVESYGG